MSKPIEVRLDSVDFGGGCRRSSSSCDREKTKSNLKPSWIEFDIGLGFDKNKHHLRKELDLKMSKTMLTTKEPILV